MTKPPEERVLDAAKALYANDLTWETASEAQRNYWLTRAQKALAAADSEPEPSRWPSDEFMEALTERSAHEYERQIVADLLLEHDAIIKAAVELAHRPWALAFTSGGAKPLVDAVREAGL